MPQFFIKSENVNNNEACIVDKSDIKHIKNVLRLSEGDDLLLTDENEITYRTKISKITSEIIKTTIYGQNASVKKLKIHLTLAQSILKSSAQDIVIQKAAELGVKEITPLCTKYSVVKFHSEKDREQKTARWQKIAFESCKQCERCDIPTVNKISDLAVILEEKYDIIIACVERNAEMSIKQHLQENKDNITPQTKILLLIGPEGGWSDKELTLFTAKNIPLLTLGNLILRAETAVITALSDIIYEYEL